MSKWILVFNMVTGQLGRMVPDSKRKSQLNDTCEIQMVPNGLFGSTKKVWIRNIPNVNGMVTVIPPDTSLAGVESQMILIMASQSPEQLQNAIITQLNVFSKTAIANLTEKIQQQNMALYNAKAEQRQLSRGVQGGMQELRKAQDIMTKDTTQKKRRQFESPPDYNEEY